MYDIQLSERNIVIEKSKHLGLIGVGKSSESVQCAITGMTNYPIGHHQTKLYPTGPNQTTPHSTSYFLPPTPGQSLILSLTYTLQIHLIIDVPTSIQLWRICFKVYSLLVSKVCADCAELRYSEQLWTEM